MTSGGKLHSDLKDEQKLPVEKSGNPTVTEGMAFAVQSRQEKELSTFKIFEKFILTGIWYLGKWTM